jgi:hypothetical protein
MAGALLVAVAALGVAVVISTPSPITRVDAVGTTPGLRPPEAGPVPPPPADQAVPGDAGGTSVVAAPPRSAEGSRAGAPTGAAPPPRRAQANAADDPRTGDARSGEGDTARGGGSVATPSGSDTSAAPVEPEDPQDDVPEPAPPSTEEEAADDPPGLVTYVVDTVKSVTGRLLGG